MRSRYLRGQQREIYDNEREFRDTYETERIIYPWQGGQIGDWVRADDGSIQQILNRRTIKRGKYDKKRGTDYILTLAGTFFVNDRTTLDAYFKRNPYSFGGNHRDFLSQPITKREITFSRYIANGEQRVKSYMLAFKTNDPEYAEKRSGFLLSTERVQRMISTQVQEAADETGISPKYIFEKLKEIIEGDAEDKVVLKALDQAGDYIGMKAKDTSIQEDNSMGLLMSHVNDAMFPAPPVALLPERNNPPAKDFAGRVVTGKEATDAEWEDVTIIAEESFPVREDG